MNDYIRDRLLIVQTALNSIKNDRGNSAINVIIRYATCDIFDVMLNEQTNSKINTRPDFAYMSEEFYSEWVESGSTPSTMSKIGVYEHRIPLSILIENMLKMETVEELYEYLTQSQQLVWVTKKEDRQLNELGYKSTMPKSGDRYKLASIRVLPQLVKFKNKKRS